MGSCLFLRKGDVHTAPGALPLGYSALEYIQSTGAQYIDTGFKHNQNTRVVIKAQVTTQHSSHAWLFEGRESGVSHKSLILLNGRTWNTDYKNGVMDGHRIAYSSVGVTDLLNIDYNKNVVNINGNTHTYEVESFQSNYNLTLFAANTAGNVAGFISAKMWYCQIYDNDVLVRDFIPCKNAEGVAGMLDLVEKKFYPSASDTALVEPPSEGLPAIGTALNDMTWDEVKAISDMGLAADYFAIGDCKAVTISGTVGATTFSNLTLYAYVLGINHNESVEGPGIHFGCFKTAQTGGVDVALVDSEYYGTVTTNGYFAMNISKTNSGGWASCKMRTVILGSDSDPLNPTANTLLAAFPAGLRVAMKPITKYSENKGGGDNWESDITATTDYLPLLAVFEVLGTYAGANKYEGNYMEQYDYYKSGNSKVKYLHDSYVDTCTWWTRSTRGQASTGFCNVSVSGEFSFNTAYTPLGVAPLFMV